MTGPEAAELVSNQVGKGTLTTYFESDDGRILTVVTNGIRAMVMLLWGEGDPGEHAVTPGAVGSSDGYVLENGQVDTYEDADTVPLAEALDIVRSIIDSGTPPSEASWNVDR
ncbi:hypothetical protein N803_14740 [Knoellia subterranea KCTC 19937]|uniref:Immunity protein Imm1 n=1 Tax=Knoellia subterranea KCTC 19937 TaxID=1385521 RepID=A0A0A0JNB8_9MICO|nr:hypothetical protein N803_14740 [Knoellia subterranea KCTC 19937]